MARFLPVLPPSPVSSSAPRRAGSIRLGIGIEVITIIWMVIEASVALTLLAGLLLNHLFGWWWADPLAALAWVYFIVQEGREAWHEARTGESCSCGADEEKDCCTREGWEKER